MKTDNIQKRIDTITKLNSEWYIVEGSQYFTDKEKAKRLEQIENQVNQKQDELVRLFVYHGLNVNDFYFEGSIDVDSLRHDIKELIKKNIREVDELNKLIKAKLV